MQVISEQSEEAVAAPEELRSLQLTDVHKWRVVTSTLLHIGVWFSSSFGELRTHVAEADAVPTPRRSHACRRNDMLGTWTALLFVHWNEAGSCSSW